MIRSVKKLLFFTKLSFLYWKGHKKRILTMAAVCTFGAAALCFSCLYVRSEKALVLEQELQLLGDYDAVFYCIEETDLSLISEHSDVSAYGFYRELGYAGMDEDLQYKVASFSDRKSAEMYHMTCIQGNYPQNEREIAIDANIAKKFGIAPAVGEKITLPLYDIRHQKIGEREYTISGIFQVSSADSLGGFYRYPSMHQVENKKTGEGEYNVPVIYVSDSEKDIFHSTLITVYIQTETKINELASLIAHSGFSKLEGYEIPAGRAYAYSYILGMSDHISNTYGELNVSSLLSAIRDGNIWKDFYSSVLIPLFALLILIIVAVSIYSLVQNIIMGRSREIAILRSIGMTKQGSFLYLFAELMVLTGLFLIMGLIAGSLFHYFLIHAMNAYSGTKIPLGFYVSPYVVSVTLQPLQYAAAVIGISSVAAVFMPLWKMACSAPVSVFSMDFRKKTRRFERHFSDFTKIKYKNVINRHIRFHDRSVLIIMSIMSCAAFFGYNYFRSYSDFRNSEYRSELTESGLGYWDFTAEKNNMARPYVFLIENHHDYGIDPNTYQSLAQSDFMENAFARMVNKSTRLVYPKDSTPEAVSTLMEPFYMREYEAYETSEDSYERTEYEAENAMLEQIGYYPDENIYALSTIGVLQEEFAALSPYVTDGEINVEKIKSGEEVLLVVPAGLKETTARAFHVGDPLPLSDIILSKEEESYPFLSFSPFDYVKPSYLKYVKDPGGNTVRYVSFAFGKRKDFETKIGAVIVLDDEELCEKYLLPSHEFIRSGKDTDEFYSPGILCLPETFAGWGLPDRLFTEVKFAVGDKEKLSEANKSFYKMLGTCSGLTYASSFEIREKMEANIRNTMTIYYIMIFMLILLGMLASGIKFYSRIKLHSRTIARLRAVGMSLPQIERLILQQNVADPLLAGGLAVIPVFLCEMFFHYVRRQIDTGAWAGLYIITETGVPWYHNVPFRYSLFAYHPAAVLLVIVLVFEALILLATVPQIRYMRKQIIAETIDTEIF